MSEREPLPFEDEDELEDIEYDDAEAGESF